MPGNPHECRLHAQRCATLAKEATTPADRRTFLTLAESWLALAAELESANLLLNAINGMKYELPEQDILVPQDPSADDAHKGP